MYKQAIVVYLLFGCLYFKVQEVLKRVKECEYKYNIDLLLKKVTVFLESYTVIIVLKYAAKRFLLF